MAAKKIYTIEITQHGFNRIDTRTEQGTLPELVEKFRYLLEVGACYQYDKGKKTINQNPKTIKSLITNLNNSVANRSRNGYSGTYYELAQ